MCMQFGYVHFLILYMEVIYASTLLRNLFFLKINFNLAFIIEF